MGGSLFGDRFHDRRLRRLVDRLAAAVGGPRGKLSKRRAAGGDGDRLSLARRGADDSGLRRRSGGAVRRCDRQRGAWALTKDGTVPDRAILSVVAFGSDSDAIGAGPRFVGFVFPRAGRVDIGPVVLRLCKRRADPDTAIKFS